MLKRTPTNFLLFFMAVLIAVSLLANCGSTQPPTRSAAEPVTGVKLETVSLSPAPLIYEAVGTIRSVNTSVLSAQIGGAVREIKVQAGDRVRAGQLLAVIDDRVPRAQADAAQAGVQEASHGLAEVEQALAAATADRQFAEATFRRYETLFKKKSVSHQEFDGVEAKYKAALANERALTARKQEMEARNRQAQAQKSSAETGLSYARILAPMNGVVTQKSVDAGTVVMPGMPLLTIEDVSRYRLEASVPDEFLPRVKLGQVVEVTTNRGQVPGRVSEIVPASDPGSRTFMVKIGLPKECQCQSGEYAKAAFAVGEQRVISVPRNGIVSRGELEGLFVADPAGQVQYRLVKTGKTFGDRIEVLSGLEAGERVAVSGISKLRDGVRVEAE